MPTIDLEREIADALRREHTEQEEAKKRAAVREEGRRRKVEDTLRAQVTAYLEPEFQEATGLRYGTGPTSPDPEATFVFRGHTITVVVGHTFIGGEPSYRVSVERDGLPRPNSPQTFSGPDLRLGILLLLGHLEEPEPMADF